MGLKIAYGITACSETVELEHLIPFLYYNKREQDQIFVLLDKPKASSQLLDLLYRFSSSDWITLKESKFEGDFSKWKNELIDLCNTSPNPPTHLFNIDADETPTKTLIEILPTLLESNPEIDMYWVPRWNIVEGITQQHIEKWGWVVDQYNRINYPDYQSRIHKNSPEIKWNKKVHENLVGFKTFSYLPIEEGLELIHPKSIERQEKQNQMYSTL